MKKPAVCDLRQDTRTSHAWRMPLVLIAVLLTGLLGLAGCTATQLPAGYNEAAVIQAAKTAIEHLNAGEYAAITDEMVRDDLKAALSAEVLANAAAQVVSPAGAFQSYQNTVAAGGKIKETGEAYAIVVVVAEYEQKKVTFTISFNQDLKIIGFFLK